MDLYSIRQSLNAGIPITALNLKVTFYSRVSTDHEEQKSSLKNQVEHFEEMIKNNSNWIYCDGYIDEGISGTSDIKRESFMQMIEDAKNNKFDLIITKEISRFSRNTLDSIKYTRELLNYGVAVLFINDNINTAFTDSELRLTIMASMAQDEIRRLSERVKFGMNRSIKNGKILGNSLLFGYKKKTSDECLRINPKEAKIVRAIFSMYGIENKSINHICRELNEQKIMTSRGKKWCPSTISRMLSNPKYKGYYCGKKTEIIDYMTKRVKKIDKQNWVVYKDKKRICPIVTEELWNRVSDKLKKQEKSNNQNKNIYPFSNKIYCSNHNAIFRRRKHCRATNDFTWICSIYLTEGKKKCDSANLRESELYTIMEYTMLLFFKNYKEIVDILGKKYQKNQGIINISTKEVNVLAEIEKRLNFEYIKEKVVQLLVKKIMVEKRDEQIFLISIYLNLSNKYFEKMIRNFDNKQKLTFERGYDTKSTKRYQVEYIIEYKISDINN